MKKIKMTLSQLNEVLNVAVDVQNKDINGSIQKAKAETDKSVGSGVERNYVISGDEVNEDENSDLINDNNIFAECVNFLLNEIKNNPDLESIYTNAFGYYNMGEVMDALSEIYTDATNGKILYNDRVAYKKMKKAFMDSISTNYNFIKNESKIFSKKQIEESIAKNNRYVTMSKKELRENLLKELDSKTYNNAAKKSLYKGQRERFSNFNDYANERFHKENGNSYYESFDLDFDGFTLYLDDDGDKIELAYNINQDEIYLPLENNEVIEPGDILLHMKDRKLIKMVLQYFAKYKPDSKYNNKNYWIA